MRIPITSPLTKTFGAVALAGTTFAQFYPQHAHHGLFVAQLSTALGLLFTRDNGVSTAQVRAARQNSKFPKSPSDPK